MSQIFVSYARDDYQFAEQLVDSLEKYYEVWIDREGIQGGTSWEQTIEAAIQESDIFLVIVSPTSNDSAWVMRETIRAEQLGKYRIPVIIGGDLPLRLLELHYIDFRGSYDGGLLDLLELLSRRIESKIPMESDASRLIGDAVLALLNGDIALGDNLIGQASIALPKQSTELGNFWERAKPDIHTITLAEQYEHSIHLLQKAELYPTIEYDQGPAHRWSVELDAPQDVLDSVKYVKYSLHPSFNEPIRIIRSRETNFRLETIGWGVFDLPVEIYFMDGSYITKDHQLRF